jgi:membrane peptidoglycan carboxypeptidase
MSTRRSRSGADAGSDHLTVGTVVSHLGVIIAVSAALGVLVAGLAIPFAGGLGYLAHSAERSMKNLPEQLTAEPLAQRSRVLDRQGHVIATFYDQNRVNVPLSRIAPIMRTAIVDIEDYRFYQHGALDVKGTLRAFVNNQTNGSTQGGSSITQQMAKMTALQQARTPAERKAATADTYQRKISELRHAIAFEQHYSKDWILNRYLNIAYFGDGAYGIQAAARHYFSTDADRLTLGQAALLAGLVKNPVGYSPTTYPSRARARRNIVLERMAQLGDIPQVTADRLAARALALKVHRVGNGCVSSKAPFFCDYVRRYLLADPALGHTVSQRNQLLMTGGLTIKTTVDMRFQRAADAATSSHVHATDQAIGALAEVVPGSGEVRAISQSRPMGRDRKKGETYLNYVVPKQYGDANGFQAGSTFKVFVLAAAMQQGIPTSTRFYSPPQLSIPQNDYEDCNGPYGVYSPWLVHNSTDSGTFDMYQGTQLSVNTYFAQLEKKTGLCEPFALARKMGVNLPYPRGDRQHPAQRVPSFTLGIANVSPLEMAGAYATFAARGLYCAPRPVTTILNAGGSVFKRYPKRCQQVISQNGADTINDILRGVMAPGGFGQALVLDKPSAGKTGTINSNMAVWFDGYTPTLATVSMIAGANQLGHWITLNGQVVGGQYVATAHGSTTAGPMWADAMRPIEDLLPYRDFVKPTASNPTSSSSAQVTVPNVAGMSVGAALSVMQGAGLVGVQAQAVPSNLPKGQVVASNPGSGQQVPSGTTVYLYTSTGSVPSSQPSPTAASPSPTSGTRTVPGNGHGKGHGHHH